MNSDDKVFGMPAASGRWIFVVLGLIMNVCLGAVYAYSIFLKPVRDAFPGVSVAPHRMGNGQAQAEPHKHPEDNSILRIENPPSCY